MKKASLVVLLLVVMGCAGLQPPIVTAEDIVTIVSAPNYSKDQIFSGTKVWIAENFRSAKSVIEHEDKESGVIIGNGAIPYPCYGGGMECMAKSTWRMPFTMRVDIKDQRFRLTFTNVRWTVPPTYGQFAMPAVDMPLRFQNEWDLVRPKLLTFGDQILGSLQRSVAKDDW